MPLILQMVICLSIRQWEICDIISDLDFDGGAKENFLGCFKCGAKFSFILANKKRRDKVIFPDFLSSLKCVISSTILSTSF